LANGKFSNADFVSSVEIAIGPLIFGDRLDHRRAGSENWLPAELPRWFT
jgi:hypothetical protein